MFQSYKNIILFHCNGNNFPGLKKQYFYICSYLTVTLNISYGDSDAIFFLLFE